MKIFTLFFLLIVPSIVFAQNKYHDIVRPRMAFSTDKYLWNTADFVVLDKDTLFANIDVNVDLSHFDLLIEDRKFKKYYNRAVFGSSHRNYLLQWSVPLKVYIDKDFPKSITGKFKTFFSQIGEIGKLKIFFVNKIKDANYYIQLSDANVNAYSEDREFDSETERLNSIYTGCTYRLVIDKNYKYYAATMKLSAKRLKNEDRALKQLKQLFFMSLGSFRPSYSSKTQSLISMNYIPQDSISEIDMKLLRVHYHILYEQHIIKEIFDKLVTLRKNRK